MMFVKHKQVCMNNLYSGKVDELHILSHTENSRVLQHLIPASIITVLIWHVSCKNTFYVFVVVTPKESKNKTSVNWFDPSWYVITLKLPFGMPDKTVTVAHALTDNRQFLRLASSFARQQEQRFKNWLFHVPAPVCYDILTGISCKHNISCNLVSDSWPGRTNAFSKKL